VLALAIALEEGRHDGALVRTCARAWARVAGRTVVRSLEIPAGVRVVAVGGATLGGSGKTPLAIACAGELAAAGARVALVGHAYRARPGRARVVAADDPLGEVGDEAIVAARALTSAGVRVVVAPTRSAAIATASRGADVIVLDGVAQTAPVRAALALLAVDAVEPWGHAGAVAPRGDLRAPRHALLDACDGVVSIGDDWLYSGGVSAGVSGDVTGPASDDITGPVAAESLPRSLASWHAVVASSGAWIGRTRVPWHRIAGTRVGLVCALGRPDRIVRFLEVRGVAVRCVLRARNHGPPTAKLLTRAARARRELGIELWLATPKCALHYARGDASAAGASAARGGASGRIAAVSIAARVGDSLGAPTAVIDHALVLPRLLRERLQLLAAP
jgi:tetraacyldisaccharide 4'-kinase